MNKKAGLYAVLLVIVTIILIGYVFYSFTIARNRVVYGLNAPNEVLQFNYENEKQLLYEQELIKMASTQAFSDTAKNFYYSTDSDCKILNDNDKKYVVFDDKCNFNSDYIKSNFIYRLENNENLKNYDFILEENNLKASTNPIKKQTSLLRQFATYTITYDLNPSFTLDLNKESININDFNTLYSAAFDCKDSDSVERCVS